MKIRLHRIYSDEEWKLITSVDGIKYNFAKKYYISNHGQVKSENDYLSLCLRNKYFRVNLSYTDTNLKHKSKTFTVHRLVCEYFCKPNINNLPTVDHIDGNTTNNYYKNLEWCSFKDQSKRAYNLGLTYVPYGEKCSFSVIDESLAIKICELLSEGKNITEIKKELNLSNKYNEIITHIRRRTSWKWLSKNYNFSTKGMKLSFLPDEAVHAICKMISNGANFENVYKKYKNEFDKFSNPRAKFNDIRIKRSYKKISDLYF